MAKPLTAFSFQGWIDEHRDQLKPPVNNQVVYRDTEFIIMVVGGPNQRTDYHINEGEEFFYQLEGDMVLKVVEDGVFKDIPIKEGEILLLPPRVPHSPQRFANTVGLVVERQRREGELDGLRWYCPSCQEMLYEERFPLGDITTQLPTIFAGFFGDEAKRTCKCGAVLPKP